MSRKCHLNVVLAVVGVIVSTAMPWTSARAAANADQLLRKLDVTRGICVVVGEGSVPMAIKLATARPGLLVYTQLADAAAVQAARRAAEAAKLGPRRLHIELGALRHFHLADQLANAVVVLGSAKNNPTDKELLRVLCPRGRAWTGKRVLTKPVPAGIGQWMHPYHSPDNNTQSRDQLARAPYMTQFMAEPHYGPAAQMSVASGGRVFKIFGHVAWHEREEPYLNTVVAFDGYNGTQLWKYKLPVGMMVHRCVFIATPKILYIGDDQSCKMIDTATGKIVDQIRPPKDVAGGTFWKWMALQNGVLYAMTGANEFKEPPARWKRTQHGWPWNAISRGYNLPKDPWGFGRNLLAIDPDTKKVLWHYHEDQPMDGRAICMNRSRIFAFRFGTYLTCLDAETGDVIWRKSKQNDPKLFETLGTYLPRQSWQTNWRTVAYLKCSDDALYFAGPQLSKLVVVSARTGDILWTNPYDNFQLILRPDAVYGISGPWGVNVSKKFDPLTGKVLAELPTGRRACTRPSASADSILYRAMGGTVRFDLESERPRWVSPMRPGCQDGVTVANGLLYWWPYVCDCQNSLYGVTCCGPAGNFDFTPDWRAADRLWTAADARPVQPLQATASDWPMFRANPRATAVSDAPVPGKARTIWRRVLRSADAVRPTAPVAVADLVFVAGDDGKVRALDAVTGRVRWTTYHGGEVRLPPTIYRGRALVGTGDGYVVAYEAVTGRILWRFRAAPEDRMIPVYGKLLSTWPAASGIVVADDTAYVAAGLANYDGTYVYALDPLTGKPKWCNDTSGHLDPAANTGVGVQGHMLLNRGTLYLAGGNAVSPAVYDARSGRCLNDPSGLAKCESTSPRGWELSLVGDEVVACGMPYYARPDQPVFDHTVTKKILHAPTGTIDIVWLDNRTLAAYKPLRKDVLNECVSRERIPRHITQAWGDFKVEQKPIWGVQHEGGIALAVAQNGVLLADAERLIALDITTGKPMWAEDLPAAPVPWGLAVTRAGTAIVTLVNGQVVAIGQ